MAKHSANNIPKRADPTNKATWYNTLLELAAKGASHRSIAARLGLTLDDFIALLDYEQAGRKPFREAMELARAQFELDRVEIKDAILYDPETSAGLKYKIVREDLKTLEEWAPATRTVNVQVESGPSEYLFEAYSPAEVEAIKANASRNDSRVDDIELDKPVDGKND